MHLTTLDEASIQAIGHAFGYYDYGKETGMGAACSSPDKTALYICGFVRAMLAAGLLYTTSERGEAFIALSPAGRKGEADSASPADKRRVSGDDLPGTVPVCAADEARRGKPE